MEKRSRSTSVRLSGIFYPFIEGKGEQQDHQSDLPESKKAKNVLHKKVSLFSFKRRTKSENEVTEKSKSNIRQLSENEPSPSAPFLNSFGKQSVHASSGGERSMGQTCRIPNNKVYNHPLETNKGIKLRDTNQFSTKIPQSQPKESLNQQQQIRRREISPAEWKRISLDTRKTPRSFRFPFKEAEAPSAKQRFLNKVMKKEKCAESEALSKSSFSPVFTRDVPVSKTAFLDVSRSPSVDASTMLQNSATSSEVKDNRLHQDCKSHTISQMPSNDFTVLRETENLIVPNKDEKSPEHELSELCSLYNGATTPETKLDDRESSQITGGKVHPNKLTICEKSRCLAFRELIWLMFISTFLSPYYLYSRLRSIFTCFFAVKTTNAPEENLFVIKQDNTVPAEDQLQKKGKIKFSSFIRQISQSSERSSMNAESTEDIIPEELQRLPSNMPVESFNEGVMARKDKHIPSQKNGPLESLKTNGARPRYIKLAFQMTAAYVGRFIGLVVLCLLHMLWIITRVPCFIFTCAINAIVFVVKLPYVILLYFTKVIAVLAKVFYMVLSCIFLVPITLLTMLFALVLYIFSKIGKVCRMPYQYIRGKGKCKRKHQEGMPHKSNDLEKTDEQQIQVSHRRGIPSLPQERDKDLEHRSEQLLRANPRLPHGLDSKEDSLWESSVLLKESRYMELDLDVGEELKIAWYSPTQNARKLSEFSVDFFSYLFFVFLLIPLSIIAFMKPVVCFVAHIFKMLAQFMEDSENGDIFTGKNVVMDSIHSNEVDSLRRPPNLSSEFQHSTMTDGKICGIYGLKNLKRKFKKLSKQNLEPEVSSNKNLESVISVNGESITERTSSFTQMMEPVIKIQEMDVEERSYDPRSYIRRFITFLRISFHMLSIFIATSSHRVNVVLHALFYHFACACKVVISFVIRLTPRKLVKWLLIEACQYLPDLRNRSLQLQILKAIPSRVSKKLVEIYMRRVPLSVMYVHAQASLKDSPSKKIIQNLAKIWTMAKRLLETVFLTISTVFKTASRALKIKRKANAVETKRRSLLRLISKNSSDKEISK